MVSFPPRSHRMYHHLLQLAAIVTALMLICLQLSAGQHGRHNPPVCTYYEFRRFELSLHGKTTLTFAPHVYIFCFASSRTVKNSQYATLSQFFLTS